MTARIGILLVGTELLTAKVTDTNGRHAIERICAAGHAVTELRVIHDDPETIGRALLELRAGNDIVITSGGVGPTHDDLTLAAVGAALGRPMVRDAGLQALVDKAFGRDPDAAAVWSRMAVVPEGARLDFAEGLRWPIYAVDNVYCLPGVPSLFVRQLDIVVQSLGVATPRALTVVYLSIDEGRVAHRLEQAVAAYPDVAFGSYPIFGAPPVVTRITVDAQDAQRVAEAAAFLADKFGDDVVEVVTGERQLRG
ncbi:MAG: competence/damage-inducible protein A [Myxococcales bacterium]|nr:competence/damage-inducible protein A [Myxococcales bacterium]MCB9521605.1 competence/damage-inducible protein A [Myxococcales bacterium]MCB9532411.1 competence/damage-inducible protein A [Myxococcales bacterium]